MTPIEYATFWTAIFTQLQQMYAKVIFYAEIAAVCFLFAWATLVGLLITLIAVVSKKGG